MFQYMGFELTNRCDIACLHCLRDKIDERKDLDTNFILRILDEARKMGIYHMSVTGGEPTLHPDFLLIIDAMVERNMQWNIVTNAHNTEFFRELFSDHRRKNALNLMAVSLDGATQEVHDHIRGKGSFKKIMRTVTLLKSLDIPMQFQMVLTAKNIHEMEPFIILASTLGAKKAYFITLQATQKSLASGLLMTPEQYRRAQIRIVDLNKMFQIEVGQTFGYYHPSPIIKCTVLSTDALNIDYDGNLNFCCQLSNFGDIDVVQEQKDFICNLKNHSLLEGYQLMQDRIATYNKEKAQKACEGKIKGMDLFPCFYCAKSFGKLNWLKDYKDHPVVKEWTRENRTLSRVLDGENPITPPRNASLSPIF